VSLDFATKSSHDDDDSNWRVTRSTSRCSSCCFDTVAGGTQEVAIGFRPPDGTTMGAPEGGVMSVVVGTPVGITMGVVEGSTLDGAVRETAGGSASFGAGGHATEVRSTSGGAVLRNIGAWGHATGVGDVSSDVVLMNTGASTSSGAGWWPRLALS
jgi:hypothetical protein